METRKLIKFGSSSHVLALPHDWLKEHNLNKGDMVYTSVNDDGELVISPTVKNKKREIKIKEIYIDGKKIDRIRREVTSAYLNNFNIIKIKGNEISLKIKELRNIIQNLIGLEILEQDGGTIVAKDLLDLESISLIKLIHKMDFVTRSMFDDINFRLKKIGSESIMDRDTEVDRIYFLGLKTIKAILENPDLAKVFKCSYEDLFKYWHTLYHIESIADKLKGLSWLFAYSKLSKSSKMKLWKIYEQIKNFYLLTMKLFYLDDKESSYKKSDIKAKIQKMLDNLLKGNNLDKLEIRIIDKFKIMIIKIHNLLREVHNNV